MQLQAVCLATLLCLAVPTGGGARAQPQIEALSKAEQLVARAEQERAQGRLDAAVTSLRNALALQEAAAVAGGAAAQMTRLVTMMKLAALYQQLDRFDEAGTLAENVLAIVEQLLGPDHPNVAMSLEAVAGLHAYRGRHAEAEALRRRAIAINEKAYGPQHPAVALSLRGLGHQYRLQDRLDEALPLLLRAQRIAEQHHAASDPALAGYLVELGLLYKTRQRYAEAEAMYRRAFAILDAAPAADAATGAVQIITVLQSLTFLYQAQGRHAEARPYIDRALAMSERTFGRDHALTGGMLASIALTLLDQDRLDDAEPLFRRALAISERAGHEHLGYADNLAGLGMLHARRKDWHPAYEAIRTASQVFVTLDKRAQAGSPNPEAQRRQLPHADTFLLQALVAYRLAETAPDRAATLRDEAFQIAQRAHGSRAAAALAQMAARFASGTGNMAALVRQRQDLADAWRVADGRLVTALSQPAAARDLSAETALRAELTALVARLDAIDARMTREFPGFAALADPRPLTVAEVQALLAPGEALVFVATRPAQSIVWVIGKTAAEWALAPLGEAALADAVAALRCGLDTAAWDGTGGATCRRLLTRAYVPGGPPPFDAEGAHALYRALLGPFDQLLAGKQLLVAVSGPLATVPFAALVTDPPPPVAAAIAGDTDHAAIAWLAKRHAVATLPAVASLAALRATSSSSRATRPFVGFGNPLLTGRDGKDRSAWRRQTCPAPGDRTLQIAARSAPRPLVRGGAPNTDILRRQGPLPETADELCAVARDLGAPTDDVNLGERATEAAVKTLSAAATLAEYRTIHFATHGLLAGETAALGRAGEPSLLLTPPPSATAADDGLLTSSEVAQLRLDADWVVLSACNTAAGEGGDEALSGLTRAFFYAGARALLVSHWYVDSDASVKLVTRAFAELRSAPALGRAEAMRRAMLALMAGPARPAGFVQAAHPSVWAPFAVIGEGGAGR